MRDYWTREKPKRPPIITWEEPLQITDTSWKKKSTDWNWTLSYNSELEMPYYLFNAVVDIGVMASSEEDAIQRFYDMLRKKIGLMKELLDAYDDIIANTEP